MPFPGNQSPRRCSPRKHLLTGLLSYHPSLSRALLRLYVWADNCRRCSFILLRVDREDRTASRSSAWRHLWQAHFWQSAYSPTLCKIHAETRCPSTAIRKSLTVTLGLSSRGLNGMTGTLLTAGEVTDSRVISILSDEYLPLRRG